MDKNRILYWIAIGLSCIITLIGIWYILFFTDLLPAYLTPNYIKICKIFVTSDIILLILAGFAVYGLLHNKSWGLTAALIVAGCWIYSFICLFAAGIVFKTINISYIIYAIVPTFSLALLFFFWPKSE